MATYSSSFLLNPHEARAPLGEKSTNAGNVPTTPKLKAPVLSLKAHARRTLRTTTRASTMGTLSGHDREQKDSLFMRSNTLHSRKRRETKRQTRMKDAAAEEPLFSEHVPFENLPPTIRRKYFSSLERLRFAQAASGSRTASRPSRMASLRLPMHRASPSTDSTWDLNNSTSNGARKLRKRRPSEQQNMNQVDAQWFLNLPEAIKRKHFTREEQVILAASAGADDIIVDAADEAFYRLKTANISNNSMASMSPEETSEAQTPEQTPVEGAGWNQSFNWMAEEGDLDLKLDDYHKSLKDSESKARKSTSRLSFRRTLTFPSKHSRADSFSFFSTASTASSRRQSLIGRRPGAATSISLSRSPAIPHTLGLDAEAQYYQDPEARLKLRVYLASPQKFDEAIEFGFPASAPEHAATRSSSRPGTATVRRVETNVQEKSFLFNDEKGAFEEIGIPPETVIVDEEIEDVKDVEPVIETGPSEPAPSKDFDLYEGARPRTSNVSHFSRENTPLSNHHSHYRTISTANREMTLRMTLTRPDLRADESMLYGWQKELPSYGSSKVRASTDMGAFFDGNWDELKRDENVVRKMWRKVARR